LSRWWTAIAGILFLPGCVIVQVSAGNPIPGLSTVAVAPFFNLSSEPERVADGRRMALAYYAELQKTPGFQVIPVGVAEQAIRENNLRMDSPDDALALCRILDCDAVVVGAITDYEPYFPPRVGLQIAWYSPYPWAFQPGMPVDPCARDAIRYGDEDAMKARIHAKAAHGGAWARSQVGRIPHFGRSSCNTGIDCRTPGAACDVPAGACDPTTRLSDNAAPTSLAPMPATPPTQGTSPPMRSPAAPNDDTGSPPAVFRGQSDPVLSVRTNLPASLAMPPPDPEAIPFAARPKSVANGPAVASIGSPSNAQRPQSEEEVPEGPWSSASERLVVERPATLRPVPQNVVVANAAPDSPPPLVPLKPRVPPNIEQTAADVREGSSVSQVPRPPVPQPPVPSLPPQPIPAAPPSFAAPVLTEGFDTIAGFDPRRPLMSYTRLFDARDPGVMAALRDWLELAGDRRSGGWQATLYRSEDFLRFCSQRMVIEMLTLHGGEAHRRIVFKFRHYREP